MGTVGWRQERVRDFRPRLKGQWQEEVGAVDVFLETELKGLSWGRREPVTSLPQHDGRVRS